MRAQAKRGRTHHYVGSADRRTIEQRGRLARQALEGFGDAERDRRHGLCDRRQIGCDRRNAQHGAARSRRTLAVVLMLGVPGHGVAMPGHGVAGIGVIHRMLIRLHRMMLVRGRMFRPEHPHAHARRWPFRTGARGTRRHRRAPAPRPARARKTDRAGRQTTLPWRAQVSSSERTWRQPNAVSRFSQGIDKSLRGAAPSHLHAQYRGNVA